MSLEEAIKENTAAIRELIAVMTADLVSAREAAAAAPAEVPVKKEPEAKKSTPAPAENTVSSPNGASPQSETPPDAQEPIVMDLTKDIVPVFSKLCVAKGREAGAEILKKWNVAKLSQVPPNRLNDLLADIQQAAA